MATKEAPQKHPYIRVVAPSAEQAIEAAGKLWAGTSEVPRNTLSTAQLAELKQAAKDKRLELVEFERPHVIDA